MTTYRAVMSRQVSLDALQLPLPTHQARIEWCGERVWDVAESVIGRPQAELVLATIIGWADSGPEHERKAFLWFAGRLQELIHKDDDRGR